MQRKCPRSPVGCSWITASILRRQIPDRIFDQPINRILASGSASARSKSLASWHIVWILSRGRASQIAGQDRERDKVFFAWVAGAGDGGPLPCGEARIAFTLGRPAGPSRSGPERAPSAPRPLR